MLEPHFGHWLAGLVDGEGCFRISTARAGAWYQPRFLLTLRDDDRAVLELCRRVTGVGSLYRRRARAGSKPGLRWEVHARNDVARLVEIFDAYPLRSKKARDYGIWRDAVRLVTDQNFIAEGRANQRSGRPGTRDWSTLANLKAQLEDVRRYPEARV